MRAFAVARWADAVAEATISKGLKLRAPVTALKLARSAYGRVSSVHIASCSTTQLSGGGLSALAGLHSTWVAALGSLARAPAAPWSGEGPDP